MLPVVLVHGIWDDARSLAPLGRALRQQGFRDVHGIDLTPPWGTAPLEVLARQLANFVSELLTRHQAPRVHVVGFSMGALVARLYLEDFGGAARVKSFVSISGPHRGSLTAYALPLAGVRQMRPESALLARLKDDVSHLPEVAVHCLYTPFDAMIVPTHSSVLRGARSVHRLPVALHRWMLSDARVLSLVPRLLREAHSSDATSTGDPQM
jgi:triacylglycerol esterase/lipase EstA (alpha/beta hydrolase family)